MALLSREQKTTRLSEIGNAVWKAKKDNMSEVPLTVELLDDIFKLLVDLETQFDCLNGGSDE